jgi:hypothetical protein
MHGDGKCKKQYPRKFQSEIVMDVNGYPIYRRRDTGRTILVHGVELDNRWVVPHNVYLSTLRSATTFVQSSICLSTFTKDIKVQLLRFHAEVTMPLKGMWSKLMKFKNISTIAMYLYRK